VTFRRVLLWGLTNVGLGAAVTLGFFVWLAAARPRVALVGADATGWAGIVPLGMLLFLVAGTLLAANLVWAVAVALRKRRSRLQSSNERCS
jgi:hypothetical protein